jgi:hypothetical protein
MTSPSDRFNRSKYRRNLLSANDRRLEDMHALLAELQVLAADVDDDVYSNQVLQIGLVLAAAGRRLDVLRGRPVKPEKRG